MSSSRLLGDIGGTNVHFALLERNGRIHRHETLRNLDYDAIDEVLDAYLGRLEENERPTEAAFGIAAPVTGDRVAMINAPWSFSLSALKKKYGWTDLHAVNDFVANALAVPHLETDDVVKVGEGAAVDGANIAVLGPGTGLGVAGLVKCNGRWTAIAGEG